MSSQKEIYVGKNFQFGTGITAQPRTYQPRGTGIIPTKVPILTSAVVGPQFLPILPMTPAVAPRAH